MLPATPVIRASSHLAIPVHRNASDSHSRVPGQKFFGLRGRVRVGEAGWRPFIGWVGGIALAYQFILYPLMVWGWSLLQSHNWVPATLQPPPVLPAEQLWVILSGMLGIAGLHSFDKLKGTDTTQIGAPKAGN